MSPQNVEFVRECYRQVNRRCFAVVHTSGRAKATGIELDQLTHLWTLSDGKAFRLETYSTKQEAHGAAGVSE